VQKYNCKVIALSTMRYNESSKTGWTELPELQQNFIRMKKYRITKKSLVYFNTSIKQQTT
jgi:TnpA family transposase